MTLAPVSTAGLHAASAVALALLLEAVLGEVPTRVHPVAWFGNAVGPFDREWSRPLLVGTAVAVVLPVAAAALVGALVAGGSRFAPLLGVGLAGVLLFCTTSLQMLLGKARAVVELTAMDLEAARQELRSLAGRDASKLSAGQVRSAAVESAAENLADGLVAPLLAFAVGAAVSLPVAAGVAAWVKAVNTLDSMLGYRSKRVGTPSARLDDAVMWLPARLSAALLAVAALDPRSAWRARTTARAPPSPNSGWPMATLAAALGVRLEKPGSYELPYGDSLPSEADASRAIRIVGAAGVFSYVLACSGVVAWS